MNVPSQIPTSFVPHETLPTSSTPKHTRADIHGAFSFLVYGVLGLIVVASIGMFIYERVLSGQIVAQQALIVSAQKTIDTGKINQFVLLRDQLSSVHTLLDNHVTLSRFFDVLESTTVHGVSFSSFKIDVQNSNDKTTKVTALGVARDFNTLAAEARSVSESGALQQVRFSGISVNRNNTVNFTLNAVASNSIVKNFSAVVTSSGSQSIQHVATSTSSTTTAQMPLIPKTP